MYVGRLGLTDSAGRRLLVDWRSPAAEPFFGATHANPMGLASRRRYRWAGGRVSDYWDEVFTPDGLDGHAALDDQSAFIASLGSSRSAGCGTCWAPSRPTRTPIIRAGSRGALVVDGGPGTGKTVVALHRTAYLLYSDPRLGHRRGGVLFVGPHQPYLAYVADVLPSLGEEGVQTCTLRDLVPEGATAGPRPTRRWPGSSRPRDLVAAIEPAVRFYEEPPTEGMTVETPWGDLLAAAPTTGPRRSTRRPRHAAQRGPRRRSGRSCSTILVDQPMTTRTSRRTGSARRCGRTRAARRARPGVAADRAHRPRRATSGRSPPTCASARPGSAPRR